MLFWISPSGANCDWYSLAESILTSLPVALLALSCSDASCFAPSTWIRRCHPHCSSLVPISRMLAALDACVAHCNSCNTATALPTNCLNLLHSAHFEPYSLPLHCLDFHRTVVVERIILLRPTNSYSDRSVKHGLTG